MKMLEYRVNFYKYTLKTIPLSILHGDGILKGPLTLIDILSSSIRKRSVKWYACVCSIDAQKPLPRKMKMLIITF